MVTDGPGMQPSPPIPQVASSGALARPGLARDHWAEQPLHVSPPILPAPTGGFAAARAKADEFARHFGPSLGNVFLIPHPWIGMMLWGALAWNPRHAAFGLLGLVVALVYERLLHIEEETQVGGGLKANALLAAVAAAWMTGPTAYPLHVQIGIAIAAATSAFVLTGAILRLLRDSQTPALLWGFCITAGAMFAIFSLATRWAAEKLTWWQQPLTDPLSWVTAFLRSIGSLVFTPSVETGAIVLVALLLWSRTALIAGIVAWAAGAIVAGELTKLGVVYYWLPSAYNFFIAGIAIGAFFIVPAYSSLPLAAMAGVGASLFEVALQSLMPEFAYLPAAAGLTIWCGMATLTFARDRPELWRNRWPKVAPEMAWWRDACWSERFGRSEPLLTVPVDGTVLVAQGFDGQLSHAREFRHALDFMRVEKSGLPASDGPAAFAGSIWNAPVMAPAAGTVERVRDGVPDNPLGLSNFAEPWGNHVSIRLDQGGFALLAHLRQGGISVSPGARVEIGTPIGAAGNSGRSPVPHVHLQLQERPEPGSPTLPFRLANYEASRTPDGEPEWHSAAVPMEGTYVTTTKPNPIAYAILTSPAPGVAVWSVEQRGVVPRRFNERRTSFQVEHRIDDMGRHHLLNWHGRLLLALAPDAWRILDKTGRSPFLDVLAHAVPSIPYAIRTGMSWSDVVPAQPTDWASLALAPYVKQPFIRTHSLCVSAPDAANGQIVIESAMRPSIASIPRTILCTLDMVRGPVAIEATFQKGSLHYSLVSFSPGLPLTG